ncbi:MAG: Bcr/CflA family efflux MFS transporter [Proteobacteria bacterium]|nr:Bcr/CflA family efflux MFS transporter [Pseudomonadota bacterium]
MTESSPSTSRHVSTREFTVLMAFLMSIIAISIDAMLPAIGIIGKDLGVVEANHVQYIIGFIFLGMTLGQMVCGPLSDALGRKKVLYMGIGLYLAGSSICFLAHDFTTLLVGRFIQGIGVSGPYVSTMSIVRDKYSGRDMARIMSLIMMIFIMVPAIAPSLGQLILFVGSWRHIFLLYIVYSITIGSWLFFRLEETLPPPNRIPFKFRAIIHGFGEVVKNRTTIGYTLCMGIVFGSFIGYLNSSQQIFQVQFHTGAAFTLYFGGLALLFGVSSLVNSKFVEKLGMRYICRRSALLVVTTSFVFAVLHFLVDDIKLWMFLIYAGVLFFSFGLMFGNLNSIAMEPMGHIAGIASAVIGATSSILSTGIGALIGQLYDNTVFPMTCGFLVFGVLSLILMAIADKGHIPTQHHAPAPGAH